MKKELAKYIETIEEERKEATRIQRKLIQMEENHKQMKQEYEEILSINKELELQIGEIYLKGNENNKKKTDKLVDEDTKGLKEQGEEGSRHKENIKETGKKKSEYGKGEGKNNRKVCLNYVKNSYCRFEKECKYEHQKLCKWTVEGKICSREICRYSHDITIICKWNKDNKCRYGDRCKFIHLKNKDWGREKQKNREEEQHWKENNFYSCEDRGRNTDIHRNKGKNEEKEKWNQTNRLKEMEQRRTRENSRTRETTLLNQEERVDMENRIVRKLKEILKIEIEKKIWATQDQNYYIDIKLKLNSQDNLKMI